MANDAVDKVRRGEPKRLLKDGDDRLKGSKYFWLTSLENHSEKQHARFSVHLQSNARYRASLVLQRALARSLGSGGGRGMKKLARSLKDRIDTMVPYGTHGITNAEAERINSNSKIISIKRRAGGYRNIENFKTAVSLYCGGLDLDPR